MYTELIFVRFDLKICKIVKNVPHRFTEEDILKYLLSDQNPKMLCSK